MNQRSLDRRKDVDRRMMARAIHMARRGEGLVEPNPMVGCVIVRGGQVIGEGYHHRFGGPHAEIEALRACTTNPRGATVYVSLEPCCHHGKTPPCADALIDARVARVVVGHRDPSPSVRGRGIKRLQAAGIRIETGVLADQAAELIAPFISRVCLDRPYVIAKWAQSLDGKLATSAGHSQWISSEASRRRVHRLRARVDAVLVGSGTVKADDPLLTARGVRLRRRATRVVLDRRLRIPERCHLVGTAREIPTLVFTTTEKSKTPKAERLRKRGVEVLFWRRRRGHFALDACLGELARHAVTNLLVEGGPAILTAFFDAGLVDEALVFTAPKLIGGQDAPTAWGGHGPTRMESAIAPRKVRIQRCGPDIVHHLRFTDPQQAIKA